LCFLPALGRLAEPSARNAMIVNSDHLDLRPRYRQRDLQHSGGDDEKLRISNRSLMLTERVGRCQGAITCPVGNTRTRSAE
jgi:hypothetical protein